MVELAGWEAGAGGTALSSLVSPHKLGCGVGACTGFGPGVPKASAGRGQLGPTPSLNPLDKQGKTALASTRLSTFALMENALKILKTICFLRSVVLRSFQDIMMYFAGWKEHH